MRDAFAIRLATVADAPVLARHRAEEFSVFEGIRLVAALLR